MSPLLKLLKFKKSLASVLMCALVLIGPINVITRQSQASNNSLPRSLTPTVKETAAETGPQARTVDEAQRARTREAYNKRPLSFEENHGQGDRRVKYFSRGAGYMLFLSPTDAVLTLRRSDDGHATSTPTDAQSSTVQPHPHRTRSGIVRMKLSEASPAPTITGESRMAAPTNRPKSAAAQKRPTNIAHYERVRYRQVYSGVDLIYYGQQQQLKYDFEVAPGADASRIALEFECVKRVQVERLTGELILEIAGGEVRQRQPLAYQEVGGERREVASRYVALNKNRVGIEVGEYDRTRPLVINSALSYATYLGGNGQDSGASSSSASQTPDQFGKDQSVKKPTDHYYAISGYVTDRDGYGIEGVLLYLDNEGYILTTYTDYEGYYYFDELNSAFHYTVTPSSDFYTFYPGSQRFLTLAGYETANFTALSGPLTISGYMTDEYGNSMQDVFVSLDGTDVVDTYTDYDGHYSFGGLQVGGNYIVTPYSNYEAFQPYEYDFSDLKSDEEADFTSLYYRSISGRVTSGVYGIGGVIVSITIIYPGGTYSYDTYTDYGGYYFFDYLLPGSHYTITPSGGGLTFVPSEQSFNDLQTSQTNVDFTIQSVSISGHVTLDTAAGAGLAGATITLTGGAGFTPRTVTTASDGTYTLTDVPVLNNYTLTPSRIGYAFRPPKIVLDNVTGNRPNKNFVATKTYAIIGVVRLGAARLPGVTVKLTSPTPSGFTPLIVTTNSSGVYTFNVPAGRDYTVTVSKTGYQFAPTSQAVTNLSANQTKEDFAVEAYSITGRLTRTDATTGLSAVTLSLTSPTPAGFAPRTLRTDSTGAYTFMALPAGRNYTLKPVKSGFTFSPATHTITNLSGNIGAGSLTNFTGAGP